jgi:hypothetical protein
MDALVFFAISMVISSVFLSQAYLDSRGGDSEIDGDARLDPASILAVLLRTSIGANLTLDLDKELRVRPTDSVGECLSVEALAVASGVPSETFDVLNSHVLTIAALAVGPPVAPHVWIMEWTDGGWKPLVFIEAENPSTDDRRAASFDLPCEDGLRFRVTLVLEPSTLGA